MELKIEIDRMNLYILITSLEHIKNSYVSLLDFEQGNMDPDPHAYWQRRINVIKDIINQISVQDKKEN